MTFQRRGKEHILYIRGIAEKEWCNSDFKIPFDTCLRHAMREHIDYILRLEAEVKRFHDPVTPIAPRMKDFARPMSALNE